MTINERVKEIRKARSLTMKEFGSKIGISDSAVSQIEKGKIGMTDQTIRSICREFGVREAWLRGGEPPMDEPEPVDEIEAIVRRYGLDRDARVMIERFVALPADQRRAILEYIRSVVDAMVEEEQLADAEAAYEKSLDSAPSAGSDASSTTGATA